MAQSFVRGHWIAFLLGRRRNSGRSAKYPMTKSMARQAEIHGVPEALVHRIVKRESRYQPGVVHRHCFGLMQIKYATAREMGYKGDAKGLLYPKIRPYLPPCLISPESPPSARRRR